MNTPKPTAEKVEAQAVAEFQELSSGMVVCGMCGTAIRGPALERYFQKKSKPAPPAVKQDLTVDQAEDEEREELLYHFNKHMSDVGGGPDKCRTCEQIRALISRPAKVVTRMELRIWVHQLYSDKATEVAEARRKFCEVGVEVGEKEKTDEKWFYAQPGNPRKNCGGK